MRVVLLLPVVALWSCEAQPHLQINLRFPAGVTPDPALLQVELDDRSEPMFTPRFRTTSALSRKVAADAIDLEFRLSIGARRFVFVHAWYDANGSGELDPGELVGDMTPAPYQARDPGGCGARVANRAPDLVLAPRP